MNLLIWLAFEVKTRLINIKISEDMIFHIFTCMACVCCRYNALSDWLINCRALFPRNVHGLMTGLQKQSKKPCHKPQSQDLLEIPKPRPCRSDLPIARSIRKGFSLRFYRKDLTLG